MRELIGNSLNTRSVLSNIINDVCPNVIILYGDYGTGKTEFAVDIAKMLTCKNLNQGGYCGECDTCKLSSAQLTDTSFLNPISLTNMTMVNQDDVMALVKENSSVMHHGNKVYIYDEFHAVPKKMQEMWLSETNKLDGTYLILTTTKLFSIDKGITSRAIKIKMNLLNLLNTQELLRMYDLYDIDNSLIPVLHEAFHGSPRDILVTARYCLNSGLSVEEQIEFVTQFKKAPIEDILLSIDSKTVYFETLRKVLTDYSKEEVVKSTDDYIWRHLVFNDEEFMTSPVAAHYSRDDLIRLLSDVHTRHDIAFISLYSSKKFKKTGESTTTISARVNHLRDTGGQPKIDERSGLTKW